MENHGEVWVPHEFYTQDPALYGGIESIMNFNSNLCAPFRACRGVWQGCALSGMLYAFSLEPLLCKMHTSITGLVLPGFSKNIVLSAYAGDRDGAESKRCQHFS